jgi:purine-binding chemotaxis protein CheW
VIARRVETGRVSRLDHREAVKRHRLDLHAKSVAVKQADQRMFVCFAVGEDRYLLDILRVKEVARVQKMTRLPKSPPGMAGVIDLRGTFVPIVDIRRRLDLPSQPPGRQSRIIVVVTQGRVAGLLVDQLLPVVRLSTAEVQAAPRLTGDVSNGFLTGMCSQGEEVYLLINLERLIELPVDQPPAPPAGADTPGRGDVQEPI